MGLWICLVVIGFIIPLLLTIFNDEEWAFMMVAGPIIMAVVGGLLCAAISCKDFDTEKLTKIDVTVEVVATKNANGTVDYVFEDPRYNRYQKVSDTKFDDIQVAGDKMLVRGIVRATPRTFWKFGSSSSKLILITPENKK